MAIEKLSAEFDRSAVHWRPQGTPFERNGKFSCLALAYIDARDVQDRLDEVCSPAGWQNEFTETAKGRVMCRIGILLPNVGWVWKGDGAGDTDVEGEKGGISDALKRAGVAWGIGRYLYRLKSPFVECEVNQKNGKTYWKRWSQDPWDAIRAPAKPAEVRQVGPSKQDQQVANNMLAAIRDHGPGVATDPAFARDLAALRKNAPELAAQVDAEIETKQQGKAA